MRDRMSEIFGYPVTDASRAPRLPDQETTGSGEENAWQPYFIRTSGTVHARSHFSSHVLWDFWL